MMNLQLLTSPSARGFTVTALSLAAVLATAPSHADVVITGDPTSTTGANLQRIGNSQDAAFKADELNGGFAYDIYVGRYNVQAGDSTSGPDLIGNTGEGATGGAFDVGDDIYVIGWKSTATNTDGSLVLSTGDNFLKIDPNGNAGYQPASAPGGAVTSFSNSDAGDYQLQSSRNGNEDKVKNEFRFSSFRYNDGAGGPYVYQSDPGNSNSVYTQALEDLPFRAFGVNRAGLKSNGQPETPAVESQVYLLNITDLNAASFNGTDTNDIGDSLKFYAFLAGQNGKTGVVIPEPASLALLGLGSLAFLGRRAKRSDRD